MTNKQPRTRRPRFLQRLNTPLMLVLLAIAQGCILILLLLNLLKSPTPIAEAPSPDSPVTLSFAVPPPEFAHHYWDPLIAMFEAENPDIKIKVVSSDVDDTGVLQGAYTTEFKNAEAKQTYTSYDLIYTDIVWVAKFAKAGWLRELSIPQPQLDLFLPQEVEAGRYQGKLYRLPIRSDVGVLYYRKDLLKAAGYDPPRRFPELLTKAQALQQQKRVEWGFVWQGDHYEGLIANFVEVLQDYGGFWIRSNPLEVGLDRPEAIAAAQFLLNTITKRVSPRDVTNFKELDAIDLFKKGEAGFLRNWPYAWTELEKPGALSQRQVGVLPLRGACRGGWGFAIAQRAKYPNEALRAIQFFASEAAQRKFVLQASYVPTLKTLFTDPQIVQQYPFFPELINALEKSTLRPAIPEYEQVSKVLQDQLSKMLREQLSPEAAMKAAADQTRALKISH